MDHKGKSITLSFLMKDVADLFITLSFITLLSAPLALAREAQPSLGAKDQAQPVVSAGALPAPEEGMTQAPESYAPSTNSTDFLMEEPPLTQSAAMDAAPVTAALKTPAAPLPLQVLQGATLEETDEVAMLVSEQCAQSGNAAEGTNSCERVYSNGHHATVLTQNANEGDELKRQTVIEEFDADDTLLFKKTIRHRVDYNYLNDQKAKEKEFFDIIYQPAGRKTTRELMVYEYFLNTGKARSLSWTQYEQLGSEPKAGLVYHALLRYAEDGSPDRGLAERWDHGAKADTFMDWSRRAKGFAALDEESWNEWEGWIRTVSLQAYLP